MTGSEGLGPDWVVAELVKLARDKDSRERLKALELLGRHLGMWPGRAETTPSGLDLVAKLVEESYRRGGGKR